MEQKNNQHNGFGSGFMLGLIIGVVVTLLFTTKRGRALFKEATEKGLDKFSDLEKKIKETAETAHEELEDLTEEYSEPEASRQIPHTVEGHRPELHHHTEESHEEKVSEEKTEGVHRHPVRKFFTKKKN